MNINQPIANNYTPSKRQWHRPQWNISHTNQHCICPLAEINSFISHFIYNNQLFKKSNNKTEKPQHCIYLESHVLSSQSLKRVYHILAVNSLPLAMRAVNPTAVQKCRQIVYCCVIDFWEATSSNPRHTSPSGKSPDCWSTDLTATRWLFSVSLCDTFSTLCSFTSSAHWGFENFCIYSFRREFLAGNTKYLAGNQFYIRNVSSFQRMKVMKILIFLGYSEIRHNWEKKWWNSLFLKRGFRMWF